MLKWHQRSTRTLSGCDITDTPDSLWCVRADQVECLNRSVQTGLIRLLIWPHKFPVPVFHACSGISVIIPLIQIRTHMDSHQVWELMISLCFTSASVLIMQHLSWWLERSSPCTSEFVLIRACRPGRVCRLCNTPLHYSHVRCPNKIADRLSALCPTPRWRWWSQTSAK